MEYNSMSIVHRAYDNNTVLLATDKILFGLIMPISFANILLLFVLVLFVFIDRQRFHRNILILRLQAYFAYLCLSLGCFIFILLCLLEDRQPPERTLRFWWYSLLLMAYGPELLRCCWIAMAVERLIATYLKNVYEQHSFTWIWIVSTLLMHITAVLTTFMKFDVRWSDYTIFALDFSIDLIGCIGVYLLFEYNKILLKTKYELKLSGRYQVGENLRALKFLKPFLIVGLILTLFGTFIRIVVTQVDFLTWFIPRTFYVYNLAFNLYILVGVSLNIIWIVKVNQKVNRHFHRILKFVWRNRSNRVVPSNTYQQRNQTQQNEMEEYFVMLEKYWQ